MHHALTLLLALAAPSGADVPPPPPPFARQAEAVAATFDHIAIATAEKRDGRWQFALAGTAFAPGHDAVPPEKVLFEIGSISKVFTGLLLADAVVEGKLGLDDTLAQRLPVRFLHAETGAVTLRQLATHTSCLPRLPNNMQGVDTTDPYARYDDAALLAYLGRAPLDGKPPCAPDYSNLAFGTLGVVLEHAYGKPWATLVREKIAAPLGMVDTVQELSSEQRTRFAQGWSNGKRAPEWSFRALAGAGALRSTTADMSRFADALLAGASGPLGKAWPLLAGDYVEMPFIGGKVGLALQHVTFDQRDGFNESYGHDGSTGGYNSLVEVWPASGRALVVLASNAEAHPIAWVAVWRTSGALPATHHEIAVSAAGLADYVGVYAIAKEARFTVLRRADELVVRLTGQPFFPVFPSARDEFFYKAVDAQLTFHRDGAGKVDRLTLHQNGRDLPAALQAAPPPHIEFPAAAELVAYAGTYDFGAFQPGATFTIAAEGDVLTAVLTGQRALPIYCVGRDKFEYDVVPASLTFERDTSGKVVALTLHQNGRDMRAPRARLAPPATADPAPPSGAGAGTAAGRAR